MYTTCWGLPADYDVHSFTRWWVWCEDDLVDKRFEFVGKHPSNIGTIDVQRRVERPQGEHNMFLPLNRTPTRRARDCSPYWTVETRRAHEIPQLNLVEYV